jgi:hypothetical protein
MWSASWSPVLVVLVAGIILTVVFFILTVVFFAAIYIGYFAR